MKQLLCCLLCTIGLLWCSEQVSAQSDELSDAYVEVKITEYMNSQAELFRDAGGQTLDYLKGSTISYSFNTYKGMPNIDLGLLRYKNGSITLNNIDKYINEDGSLAYYYDQNTGIFTIERLKNKPISYNPDSAQSNVSINYKYKKYKGVVSLGGVISWFPDGNLNANYSTKVYGPTNFTFKGIPSILGSSKTINIRKNENINIINLSEYINVSQHMKGGNISLEWIKAPDTSKIGVQVAEVKVTDKLDDYIQSKVFNVNVQVEEDTKLTAEPASQTTSLGSDISKIDYSKFVTNVKLGDQSLSPDQYTVSLINNFSTVTVGDEIAKVKVTSKSDASKIVEVPVPVNVKWGNTIAISGIWVNSNNHRIVAALPFISDGKQVKLKLLPGRGAESLTLPSYPNSNSEYFSNVSFFKIDKDVNLINDDLAIQRFNLNSSNTPIEIQNSWNTSIGELTMNVGDVIGVWHISKTGEVKDRPWSYLIENEVFNDYTEYNNMTYYELTKNGYRPLHVNHLNVSNGSVPIYSSKQYLDEHVTDYIDLKGYSNIDVKGFVEYPDTTSSGDKRAKILVEETLTTGKKVQYEYEVTINIEPGTLTYTVPKTLTFKEFSKSKSEQIVQRKYSGSLGLLIKDNRGSNKQGNWTLTAKASSDLKGIAPYLIYRNEKGVDSYLNGSAVPVYTQDKQVSATEPLEVEVSNKWKSTDGILLKVPSKNNLASQEYSTTITWNLVEGP